MILNFEKLNEKLVAKARLYGAGCKKVFVATSGGVDSSLVVTILCEAFGPENVVGLYRDIKSNPLHREHVKKLAKIFGFTLIDLDANPIYDLIVNSLKDKFKEVNLDWIDESDRQSEESGFTNAYASLKSRLNTPVAGFISKAIDNGNGRIFGTGNAEEDELLRYFDKYGDGAVDNNILVGLNKAEVRQYALWIGVPEEIVLKKPSADLEANGDTHNDEDQLTSWAHKLGYDIDVSYGATDGTREGNIAKALREDFRLKVIRGRNASLNPKKLYDTFGYDEEMIMTILFLRDVETSTRHKVLPIPGIDRFELLNEDLVD